MYKRKRKQGQMHLTETTLVLFVVIIIILLGVVVYYRYSATRVETLGETLSEREASLLLVKTLHLAELRCDRQDCLDAGKFLPFQRVRDQDFTYFKEIFGRKKITLHQVYPVLDDSLANKSCGVQEYIQVAYPDNCGMWELYEHNPERALGRKVSTLVSLYFPEIDEYRIGRLEIEHYGSIQ